MGHVGRRVATATLVVVAAACGSGSGSAATLVSYARGTWNCSMTIREGGESVTLKPGAVVRTTSATTGTVTIHLGFPQLPPGVPRSYGGQWMLRSGELAVKWDRREQGTAQAKPVSLDTKQFQIRSGAPGEAKWSKVTVDRKSRSVTFGFVIADGYGPHTNMTCRKA